MRVTWTWNAAEHRRATAAIKRHRLLKHRLRLPLIGVITGGLVGGLLAAGEQLSPGAVATVAALSASGSLATFLGIERLRESRVRAQFATKYEPSSRDVSVTVAPDGLTIEAVDSQLALAWSAFERVIETGDHFLFYTGPSTAYFLPKGCCPSEAHQEIRASLP